MLTVTLGETQEAGFTLLTKHLQEIHRESDELVITFFFGLSLSVLVSVDVLDVEI